MYFAVEQDFDAQAAIVTAQQHDELPIFAICLYLAAVFWLPPRLEGTKPLSLRRTWALWNLALALFSCCGAARTVPTLVRAAREHGLRYTMCTDSAAWYLGPDHRPCGLWMTLFIFSKIPELLDTIFLVAQQKDVIFLHWFHHVTVLLYCWHAFTSTPAATGLWFAAMNYSVHSVMYLYYFLSIAGLRRLARPIAPIITVVQIAQMAVGSGVTLLAARAHFAHAAGAPGAAACGHARVVQARARDVLVVPRALHDALLRQLPRARREARGRLRLQRAQGGGEEEVRDGLRRQVDARCAVRRRRIRLRRAARQYRREEVIVSGARARRVLARDA